MSGEVEMRDHCPQCGPLTWFGSDIGMIPPHVADEIERLRAEVSDLHNGINWQTTCLHCAKLLDINYDQYCQIERLRAAGDALAKVAAQVGNHRLGRHQTNAAIAAWQEANHER